MSTQKKKFSPFEIFEDLKNANLDPSIFEKVDERDFDKAPNFIDWALEPKFASTTVLPKQIEIGTKLCMEWCPRCSNPGYIDALFDQTIGNIKDNIVFLEHGVCPKCKSHRLELVNEFNIEMKNELVGAMGQRCVPKGTLIFTDRGVLPIEKVKVGDLLSHGRVSEVYDSGVRPCTSVTTEHGWVLRGATDTHIVAVLAGCSIMWKKLCEVVPGDTLLLCSPGLYSSEPDDEVKFTFVDDAVLSASAENQRKWLFTLLGTTDLSTPNLKFFTSSASVAAKARLLLLNMGIFSTSYVFEDYHRVTVLPQTSPIVVEGSEYFPVKVLSSERTPDVHMYDVHVPVTNAYAGDGFLHHNSGKTKTVGLLASYITHRFLKIPNPLRYFGQPTGELLLGTFSALTLEQASQTLWESYKGFVNGSPWFSQYHSFLKAEGKRLGVELLHDLKTSTLYSHKQMLWHATGSQDRKMRGKTRIFAAIDELGWFIMDESKPDLQNMNADGVYTALSNSLATMRMKHRILLSRGEYDAPPILMANVSSPSSAKDKIMRLIKDANRNHKILALALPTWECVGKNTLVFTGSGFEKADTAHFDRPCLTNREIKNGVRIVSKLGYTLDCSEEHPVKVFNEDGVVFKPAGRLTSSDFLLLDYSPRASFGTLPVAPMVENRSHLCEPDAFKLNIGKEFYRLLGLLAAEGTIYNISEFEYGKTNNYNRRVVIYNTNSEILDMAKSDAEVAFDGLRPSICWASDESYEKSKAGRDNVSRSGRLVIRSVKLIDTLLAMGVTSARLSEKTIPEFVFSSPPEMVGAYLSGLFEGDGWVYNGKVNREIAFCSTSPHLIDGCRTLLLTLGIPVVSYFKKSKMDKTNDSYNIRIRGPEMFLRFRESVGFMSSGKKAVLDEVIDGFSSDRPFYWSRIPSAFVKYLENKYGRRFSIPGDTKRSKLLGRINGLPLLDDELHVLDSEVILDPTERIDRIGELETIDFSFLTGSHEYWSKGFISHNCNPDYTFDSLRDEFSHIEDSIFMRDFGVEPPLAQSPYLSDEKVVARICTGTVTKDIEVTPYEDLSSAFVSVRTKINTQNKSVPRILTFDLGATKNGLAACLFSMSSSGKPVLDFVLSIKPTSKLRVNIADVFDNFTAPIIKSLNIKCVYFDRWQSLDQVERIRGLGVEAQVYSLTYKDMDSVRGYINSEAVVIPALPKPIDAVIQDYVSDAPGWWSTPTSDLCIQLLTVRDTGHKMLKPSHGDDDIFRAFCLGVVKMYDPAVKLLTMVQNPTAPQITGGHLGGVIPRSSGGFGRGGTGRVEGVGVSMSRQRRR